MKKDKRSKTSAINGQYGGRPTRFVNVTVIITKEDTLLGIKKNDHASALENAISRALKGSTVYIQTAQRLSVAKTYFPPYAVMDRVFVNGTSMRFTSEMRDYLMPFVEHTKGTQDFRFWFKIPRCVLENSHS